MFHVCDPLSRSSVGHRRRINLAAVLVECSPPRFRWYSQRFVLVRRDPTDGRGPCEWLPRSGAEAGAASKHRTAGTTAGSGGRSATRRPQHRSTDDSISSTTTKHAVVLPHYANFLASYSAQLVRIIYRKPCLGKRNSSLSTERIIEKGEANA
jgi:hypothetical protein